ncbi:uncharacterized protein LOC131166606 [Malania oleifera]|uniref:uncharacterized protein LOC131166606 n=1 Tax=Malania oleifera TaxID=397392 RepID=UPI0025AE91DF|nr:uncharacterized protein LOC131166606 [Malania oleifera]
MAASPLNPKANYHVRSISLPSRPHPLNLQFEEHLCRLRACEGTSSSTLPSICEKIGVLVDLFDCAHDLLLLPHIQQQTSAQECHKQFADNALDGSLRLLDVCGTAKDVLLQTKESTQELQSILRRRRGGEFGLADEIGVYFTFGEKRKRGIQKYLRKLKGVENKCSFSPMDSSHDIVAIASMFTDLEAVTFSVFESLLSYISGLKVKSRLRGWSLVSRLMHRKHTACEEEASDTSEFEKVALALRALISCKGGKYISQHVENVQKRLGKLESRVQDLEEGLDCLFRSLIRTRVSLLNILNY